MYIPSGRERVRVAGKPGLFLTVWVDTEAEYASVISLRDSMSPVEDVPFAQLLPAGEPGVERSYPPQRVEAPTDNG